MADPRYLEAWKRGSSSVSQRQTANSSLQPSSNTADSVAMPSGYGFTGTSFGNPLDKQASSSKLNVRLDTPGGVTYSPSDLTSHNVIKRMFIPYKIGQTSIAKTTKEQEPSENTAEDDDHSLYAGAGLLPVGVPKARHAANTNAQAYDFGPDIQRELGDPQISEARKYALSINMDVLQGRPEGGKAWQDVQCEQDGAMMEKNDNDTYSTVSGQTTKTTASTKTTATLATLARETRDGSLPDWFLRTSSKKDTVPFVVPPAFTGKPEDLLRPWDAMRWRGHRAFERPSVREDERGIAAFEDVNGVGNAPSLAESRTENDDGTSNGNEPFSTTTVGRPAHTLSVADLFVIDPRISRPLRMVRRTDPRQLLLLCSGVYMEASQIASRKAAEAARQAGLGPQDINTSKEAQDMLVKLSKSAEARGGIGVLFCPSDDPLSQDDEEMQRKREPRFESNACKRLESAPNNVTRNTERRAQLRAVLAAVELANWEEEGFDKIVIGVEQAWIVRGITVDIWRWRHTGWKYTAIAEDSETNGGGAPGESVRDRDLWEALDEAVRKYESIDCNVRFWHITNKRDLALARALAEQAALKNVAQRSGLVRWRKKLAPMLADQLQRREAMKKQNHQGPTLTQVR